MIRQFVAMPLGSGSTVEGQVTGKESTAASSHEYRAQARPVPPSLRRSRTPSAEESGG